MATFHYFAEHKGETVQLSGVWHDGHVSTKALHFFGIAPDGTKLRCDRKIEYKRNPSKHECGPKCQEARGFLCECKCNGKNHGAGSAFSCEQVAA